MELYTWMLAASIRDGEIYCDTVSLCEGWKLFIHSMYLNERVTKYGAQSMETCCENKNIGKAVVYTSSINIILTNVWQMYEK